MNDEYLRGLLGGGLIGLAAVLLLMFNGRILGISGIVAGMLESPSGERGWRFALVLGLLLGAFGLSFYNKDYFAVTTGLPWMIYPFAGFLVGFGTRMGNGCTSGHGVCGIGRLSPRSLVATLVFIATAAITAGVVKMVRGGGV